MKKQYSIRLRVWLDENTGTFLGMGRVILLEKIKETGSITNAAKAIKMSYRQAWQLVNDMNERAQMPVVEIKLGGSGGGGASLTPYGEKAIKSFYKMEEKIKKYAESLMIKIDL